MSGGGGGGGGLHACLLAVCVCARMCVACVCSDVLCLHIDLFNNILIAHYAVINEVLHLLC